YDSLLQLEGVGEKTALDLYQSGYKSASEVAEATVSDLLQMKDMDEEKAQRIVQSAVSLSREPPPQAEGNGSPKDMGAETPTEAGDEMEAKEQSAVSEADEDQNGGEAR
ncbi:MAG: helix-hairpin-helix domain-containing protein, partial [Desulfobacterales bacterium]|nr:helix-hairpin-helix domain-containing protein [Desulfobacterales bacterium]